ncbi:MAG TPA: O-antigen ligase family protein [bacterium]
MTDPGVILLSAVILGSCAFLLTLISTDAAVLMLVFSMLLSPEISIAQLQSRAVVIRFDDLLMLVVFFTWLGKLAINKQLGLIRRTPLNVPLGLFIVGCIVSTGWGIINGSVVAPVKSVFYLLKYIEYFLLYFMIVNVIRDRAQVARFIAAMLLTAFIVALNGYWQMVRYGAQWRVTAPFEGAHAEPNTLAGYLILMTGVCVGMALYSRSSLRRILLLGLAGFMFGPFLYTYSRGGYLGMIGMYVCLCVVSTRFRPILIGGLVASASLAPALLPRTVFERLASTFDPRGMVQLGQFRLAESPAYRVLVWNVIWEKWREHPFLGYGVTGIGFVDSQYALVIGEVGAIGAGLFLWVQWRLVSLSLRAFRSLEDHWARGLSLGFLAGFVGLLLQAISGNVFIIVRIMEPLWFLAAVVTMLPVICPKAPGPAAAAPAVERRRPGDASPARAGAV